MQMTSYDVGGSRTGTQTGFLTYGFGEQNQTKLEGIDTTEGTDANAGYFDFGSFEEFQVGGAGSGADSFAGGARLSITVKSGGDRFTGNWYSDWEGDATDHRQRARRLPHREHSRDEDGFFSRTALTRGNPIDKQYDINFNIGGPLWKGKAWFFYSYRLNDQYKTVARHRRARALEAVQQLHVQGHVPAQSQQPGDRLPEQAREAAGHARSRPPTCRSSAARYQASRNYPRKIEWTSVLGSRAFLDVLVGNWYNFFPLRPDRSARLRRRTSCPGRIDTANNQRDGGDHDAYQDQKRYKPQVYVTLSYFQDGWARQPRLQDRLRLEARSPQLLPRAAVRHLLPRPERRRRTRSRSTTRRTRRPTTSSTTPASSATRGSSTIG